MTARSLIAPGSSVAALADRDSKMSSSDVAVTTLGSDFSAFGDLSLLPASVSAMPIRRIHEVNARALAARLEIEDFASPLSALAQSQSRICSRVRSPVSSIPSDVR